MTIRRRIQQRNVTRSPRWRAGTRRNKRNAQRFGAGIRLPQRSATR